MQRICKMRRNNKMALLQVNFFSECLLRTVQIRVILPAEGRVYGKEQPFKTLYLLHGILGNDTDWISGTRIARWAEERNLAVVMPAGENHFYVDCEATGEKYGEFIGKELVETTRKMFPLSRQREDTFIAGLSMGGYGALRNGLKYWETFGAVAALSGALILERARNSDESSKEFIWNRRYYTGVFGDLDRLSGSDKDCEALVRNLKEQKADIPSLYLCCGTEDDLLKQNREFAELLKELEVPFTYEEGPGKHDWDFWDTYIKKVLEWLPLEGEVDRISSGNVKRD